MKVIVDYRGDDTKVVIGDKIFNWDDIPFKHEWDDCGQHTYQADIDEMLTVVALAATAVGGVDKLKKMLSGSDPDCVYEPVEG